MTTGALRAHAAMQEAGLGDAGPLTRVPNTTNEVWVAGRYILRVNRSGNARGTLLHELRVIEALTGVIPVPEPVSLRTSRSWAIDCIQVPLWESPCPMK